MLIFLRMGTSFSLSSISCCAAQWCARFFMALGPFNIYNWIFTKTSHESTDFVHYTQSYTFIFPYTITMHALIEAVRHTLNASHISASIGIVMKGCEENIMERKWQFEGFEIA